MKVAEIDAPLNFAEITFTKIEWSALKLRKFLTFVFIS